jgi:hypothetical protein
MIIFATSETAIKNWQDNVHMQLINPQNTKYLNTLRQIRIGFKVDKTTHFYAKKMSNRIL